jgi:AAA domain
MPTLDEVLARSQNMDTMQKKLLAMLYGVMGGGKTTLGMEIAQAITPSDERIVFVDSHQGWSVLGPHLTRRTVRFGVIEYDFNMALTELLLAPDWQDVGTVVVDEHTSLFDHDLLSVTKARAKNDKDKDPDMPQWPDMNATIQRAVFNLNRWIATGRNVIFIGHERIDKDDRQVPVISPAYLPRAIPKMCQPLHLVGHVTADLNETAVSESEAVYKRLVQCHPSRRVIAKSRLPGLSVNNSFEKVINACVEFTKSGKLGADQKEIILSTETVGESDPAVTSEG